MLENVLAFERETFLWLNGSHTPYLDRFMWLYSGKAVWLPLAAFILFLLVYKKKWREWILILLSIVLVIALCDQFASHLCKPLFTRFRPTHHPDFMNEVQTVFGYRGGLYGFMSSHAANAFGFATFITLLFRNKWFTATIFFWAILTSYSRIYLGVHFISDIIPGALVGILFGYGVYRLYVKVRSEVIPGARLLPPDALYSNLRKRMVIAAIWLTIFILLLFNAPLVDWLR